MTRNSHCKKKALWSCLLERTYTVEILNVMVIWESFGLSFPTFLPLRHLSLVPSTIVTAATVYRSPGTDSEAAAEDAAINHELGLSEDHFSQPEVSLFLDFLCVSLLPYTLHLFSLSSLLPALVQL